MSNKLNKFITSLAYKYIDLNIAIFMWIFPARVSIIVLKDFSELLKIELKRYK